MLLALRVKSFLLMDSLELRLEPGFNALTGETGAGKSIVVGALGLVLGGRASADVVRPGAEEAEVEALFDVRGNQALLERLETAGVPCDGELVVRRVVQAGGRSRAYLNGRMCTAGELSALAAGLCDVASQHESVALTDPATHLDHLDGFARLSERRAALADRVRRLAEVSGRLASAKSAARERGEREDFLRFQLQTIADLAPRAGELEELASERVRLRHAERLLEVTRRAAGRLEGDDAITDELARLVSELSQAASLDPALDAPKRALESCWSELREVGREIGRYAERTSADPSRLAEVEERLYRLEGLIRRHGPTMDEVLAARARLEGELEALADTEGAIAELEGHRSALYGDAAAEARELSKKRKEAAGRLGTAISRELADLAMGGAKVVVDVAPLAGDKTELSVDGARLGQDGIDRVEFLIAPNKGIEPRPLRKIASGGELSRSLLALKRVLAGAAPPKLFVFDEVDAGVSGAVASKIGQAIADVARHHQVLCITHLAPIAACAGAHYIVTKRDSGDVARSDIRRVEGKDRVQEIARMLSGAVVTSASLAAASELLRGAPAPPPVPAAKAQKARTKAHADRS